MNLETSYAIKNDARNCVTDLLFDRTERTQLKRILAQDEETAEVSVQCISEVSE